MTAGVKMSATIASKISAHNPTMNPSDKRKKTMTEDGSDIRSTIEPIVPHASVQQMISRAPARILIVKKPLGWGFFTVSVVL